MLVFFYEAYYFEIQSKFRFFCMAFWEFARLPATTFPNDHLRGRSCRGLVNLAVAEGWSRFQTGQPKQNSGVRKIDVLVHNFAELGHFGKISTLALDVKVNRKHGLVRLRPWNFFEASVHTCPWAVSQAMTHMSMLRTELSRISFKHSSNPPVSLKHWSNEINFAIYRFQNKEANFADWFESDP